MDGAVIGNMVLGTILPNFLATLGRQHSAYTPEGQMMNLHTLLAGIALGLALVAAERAAAQVSSCSTNGGYPEGSPAAVLAGIRNLSNGGYAACVERERANEPRVNWSPAEIRDAGRVAVLARLREPASAVFRLVRQTRQNNGTTTFCGEVSGRNGYGGMTDFVRFRSAVDAYGDTSAEFDTGELPARTHFEIGWQRYCVGGVSETF